MNPMKYKKCKCIRTFPVIALILLWMLGCDEPERYKHIDQQVTVDYVRVLQTKETVSEGDDALAGAAVGGLLFGSTGAIVGTAIGADSKKEIKTVNRITACKFRIKTDDGKLVVFMVDGWRKEECAVLAPGDRMRISFFTFDKRYGFCGETSGCDWGEIE